MSCLNASQALNALELRILDNVPSDAKHVAIVGAGDGRLARAISKNVSDSIAFTLVEEKVSLHKHLEAFGPTGTQAFDCQWYSEQVAAKGPIDYLIFYNIQEYWQANLNDFRQITDLLSENGVAWVSFPNGYSRNLISYFLPQKVGNYAGLAHPVRNAPHMDYASWVSYLNMIGTKIDGVWGLLDPQAYDFCQKYGKADGAKPEKFEIDIQGFKATVQNLQDAYLLGGVFIGLQFSKKPIEQEPASPTFTAVAFNPILFQSLLIPYPDNSLAQVDEFMVDAEIAKWNDGTDKKLNFIGKFLLDNIDTPEDIKRVLFVGARWGKDVFLMSKEKPEWEIVAIESSESKVSKGKEALGEDSISIEAFDPEAPLPFDDNSFDIVLTAGYLSECHVPLVSHLAKEFARVGSKCIYHLEDSRGPSLNLKFKNLSLTEAYRNAGLGEQLSINPVLIDQKSSGLILAKHPLG